MMNLSPFLMGNSLQLYNILGFVCYNHLLQFPPRFFYGIQLFMGDSDGHFSIFQDLWSQALVDFEVRLGSLSCPLSSQITPKLQLPHRWYGIFSQDLLILDSIHLAPENHWATTLLYCSQGVLWSGCLILPSPAILLIHRPQTSQFCFIALQNRIIIKSF